MTASIIAIAILAGPAGSLAQSGGGPNNSASDPGGAGNSAKISPPPARGTNNAGTAQSSGPAPNSQPGVTTGSAGAAAPGSTQSGPQTSGDAAIDAEDKAIDRKLKGICRGC
jgi:hypothetical protein